MPVGTRWPCANAWPEPGDQWPYWRPTVPTMVVIAGSCGTFRSGWNGGVMSRHRVRHDQVRRPAAAALFRPWTVSVTVGECVGFAVPALTGAVIMDRPAAVAVPLLVIAGSVEGAVLGWSQARVLRRMLPDLSLTRWILGTAAGAALAWLIGLLPSTFGGLLSSWPPAALIVAAALLGTVLLGSIGTAQWGGAQTARAAIGLVGGRHGSGVVCGSAGLRGGDHAPVAARSVSRPRRRHRRPGRADHGLYRGCHQRTGSGTAVQFDLASRPRRRGRG
jgi:hypothetical protein